MRFARPLELAEAERDLLDERFDIERVVVESFDDAHRGRGNSRTIETPPFAEAASCGGKRKLRIERQKDKFVQRLAVDFRNSFLSQRVPVAHGDGHARVDRRAESSSERARLTFGQHTDGRMSADSIVVMRHVLGAPSGNPPGERLPNDSSERTKGADGGVAKKIVKKWLDGLAGVRPAELK